MLGKLQRAHHTLHGHFAPAYLLGSNKLRAYLFFIYEFTSSKGVICLQWKWLKTKSNFNAVIESIVTDDLAEPLCKTYECAIHCA